jgi:hypothetical protein
MPNIETEGLTATIAMASSPTSPIRVMDFFDNRIVRYRCMRSDDWTATFLFHKDDFWRQHNEISIVSSGESLLEQMLIRFGLCLSPPSFEPVVGRKRFQPFLSTDHHLIHFRLLKFSSHANTHNCFISRGFDEHMKIRDAAYDAQCEVARRIILLLHQFRNKSILKITHSTPSLIFDCLSSQCPAIRGHRGLHI